jgi:diguanylate cyclase (GGDEF)-like protein
MQDHRAPSMSSRPQNEPDANDFVVEVSTELSAGTMQRRPTEVNLILQFSMIAGSHMQLDATLNVLCERAKEITRFDRALMYFWSEANETFELRMVSGDDTGLREKLPQGDILNRWMMRFARPVLVTRGDHPEVDIILRMAKSQHALAVPLFVSNRVMGCIQLFASEKPFSQEDAQLVWLLSRVAENLLTREHANQGLLQFAFTDHLTGLKTRGYFEQQYDLEIKRSERKAEPLALLMLDIDHFKALNDHYGHHIGDQVLREVSAVLMKDMREVDTVARYGGEEFVMMLPDTTEEEAYRVAQRIRKSVEQTKFFVISPNPDKPLSISIGVAMYGEAMKPKRKLIECADQALYFAKKHGRNRVVLYSDITKKKEVKSARPGKQDQSAL